MNKTCCYCDASYPAQLCRPYGPAGASACFTCAMLPDNVDVTMKETRRAIDRAMQLGNGSIYIGDPDGPQPMPPDGETN